MHVLSLTAGARLGLLLLSACLAALPLGAVAQEAQPASEPAPLATPLDLINQYRQAAGVPPARLNPSLQLSAQNQVNYYNFSGDTGMAGMGLHRQTPGMPGFSGITMGDRATAAGYTGGGSVTENAGFGSVPRAVDWYMNTVNHRLPLIHPSALDMGYAESGGSGLHIIDVALPRERLSVALPSVYPPDGALDVPRAWDGAETPDPAPGVPRPLGYPITVAFAVYQRVEWTAFQLWGPDGADLPISTPLTAWMRAAAIVPRQPLEPGQTYTARVEAVVDGQPLTKTWSFTTRG